MAFIGGGIRRLAVGFLIVLALALSVRAVNPLRWSDWDFGDAQTLLTLNQWELRGPLACKFLFSPQGYAPFMPLLDTAELRQHAHGLSPHASPLVGPRLLYTHYPPGYLLPYAALHYTTGGSPAVLRVFSVLLSCAALAFFYFSFELLAGPLCALAALAFYAVSGGFLGFADALANQPLDDFFRFAFMYLVLRAVAMKEARWLPVAWATGFLLSLCSFDSVFFCYLWLLMADYIYGEGFRWRKYLAFAAAPAAAHALQFFQNVWYLGLHSAWLDITATAGVRSLHGQPLTASAVNILYPYFYEWGLPALLCLATGSLLALVCLRLERDVLLLRSTFALAVCAAVFAVVFPSGASLAYQTRQLLPFFCLCFGCAVAGVYARRGWLAWAALAIFLFPLGRALLSVPGQFRVLDVTRDDDISFAVALSGFKTSAPAVFFELGAFHAYWEKDYWRGFPEVHPMSEYYAGKKLILGFPNADSLAGDIAVIRRLSLQPFSPVLAVAGESALSASLSALEKRGVIASAAAVPVYKLRGRFVADITPVLR